MREIILASQSKQRYRILKTLNIEFEVIPAHINEQEVKGINPVHRAANIALAKAQEVAKKYSKAIIIAGDTYGVLNGKIFEKPQNLDEARRMLADLSGQNILAHTGVCYLDQENDILDNQTLTVKAKMRRLSKKEIESYVTTQPVLTWSAAFCPAYDEGMALIENIQGSLTAFSHGLPIEIVTKNLRKSKVI